MSHFVREILEQSKSRKKKVNYREIDVEINLLRRIFGPRVFDQLRKVWIEDDQDVVWLRTIGEKEAEQLRPYLDEHSFYFDFSTNDYFLVTSTED